MPAKKTPADQVSDQTEAPAQSTGAEALAAAMLAAIESARPTKITAANRKPNTPWTPKDGSAKLKLKRRMFHHGMDIVDTRLTNEQIALANQVRPGTYLDGFVKVIRRRDKGIDIDYPWQKTNRNKITTAHGITSFTQLLQRIVDEGKAPRKTAEEELE